MTFRKRTQTGATTSTQKAKIFWDATRSKYLIATPFGAEAFRNDIQICCPSSFWCGKTEPYWAIDEAELNDAKTCVAGYWPDYDFIPKPEPRQEKSNGSGGFSSSSNSAAIDMFRAAGYETSKKVYSMLIVQFKDAFNNPNASRESTEKAQAITAGWRQIKKELGW